MKKCDECLEEFRVGQLTYHGGFYLCPECKKMWEEIEPSPDEYDEEEECWDPKPKEKVRLKDNYKPNPDYSGDILEGECPKCND
jgi:hypothetical protein